MYYQPGFAIAVAELDENDNGWDGSHHIVGFTSWYRHGVSETALKWHNDTISDSKYSPLIHAVMDADGAVE
jgi:uncharacterized UPF0160 family protein